MKKILLAKSGLVLAALGAATAAAAQDNNSGPITRTDPADFWSRFSVGYRAAFNISASFSGGVAPNSPNAAGTTTYADGFVGVDSAGNPGGYTTYWGYQNAGQYSGGNILMHSSSLLNSGSVDDGAQSGFELGYTQPIGGGDNWHWGLDFALDWMPVNILDNRPLAGDVTTVTHAFAFNGLVPPPAPYSGPSSGPGPLLSTTPTDSSSVNAATITGSRRIDANMYGLRLGPYVEIPICPHFSVTGGVGLDLGGVDSCFSYDETVNVTGMSSQTETASSHKESFIWGGYAQAQLNVILDRQLSLFGRVEYDDLGIYRQTAGVSTARLDLTRGLYVSGGLTIRF